MPDLLPAAPVRGKLALLGILALGLTLRVWTIGNGVPFTVSVDEPEILRRVVDMMKSGDFNPHFFDYGGLTIYFHLAIASVRFAVGALAGERDYTALDTVWMGDFVLWARVATALIGTLTIYVVYRTGLRWGIRAGLIAALITAVHPHLVRESHYALTDTPLTFLVALTLLISVIAAEDGRLRWFLIAGVTAGLSAAIKYNGMVAVLMPLSVALVSTVTTRRAAACVTAMVAAALAFLAAAPYSLLDLPHFLSGFANLAASYSHPKPATDVADIYVKHLRDAFSLGRLGWNLVGWPALLVCLLGLIVLAAQLRSPLRRSAALPVVVFAIAYFWLIAHQSLVYARYALPLAPMLCLTFGVGLTTIRGLVAALSTPRRSRQVVAGLLILLVGPPLWQALNLDWDRRKVSTDELTARWLKRNVPGTDPILLETPNISLPPEFHWDTTHRLIHQSLETYRAAGVRYLVASSDQIDAAQQIPQDAAAYRSLFASTQIVTIIPKTNEHPGPTLTVLRVPEK